MIVVLLRRRAVTPAGPKDMRLVGPMRLASASRASLSSPLEALECSHPTCANPSNCVSRLLSIAEKPATPEPPLRFPHSG